MDEVAVSLPPPPSMSSILSWALLVLITNNIPSITLFLFLFTSSSPLLQLDLSSFFPFLVSLPRAEWATLREERVNKVLKMWVCF